MSVYKNITIENARLIFRNFTGKETRFNPEGNRNFCVILDDNWPNELEKDGWLVKWLEPRNVEEDRRAYLKVKVKFDRIPPKIVLITSKNKTILDEDSINILDWAEIENVDLIIRPYNWKMGDGKTGVTAYLKTMYITVVEDEFESKYRDVPDSPAFSNEVDEDALPF